METRGGVLPAPDFYLKNPKIFSRKFFRKFKALTIAAPFATTVYVAGMSQLPTLADRKTHAFLMEALDAKQKLYIESRAMGSVPVVAARVAGYTHPDEAAIELEADRTVRMALEVSIRLKARELKVTREDVMGWMLDAYRNAATSTEMLAAAKEIARLNGLYEPQRLEINKTVEIRQEQLRNMSDDELLKLAGEAIEADYEVLDFEPDSAHA